MIKGKKIESVKSLGCMKVIPPIDVFKVTYVDGTSEKIEHQAIKTPAGFQYHEEHVLLNSLVNDSSREESSDSE